MTKKTTPDEALGTINQILYEAMEKYIGDVEALVKIDRAVHGAELGGSPTELDVVNAALTAAVHRKGSFVLPLGSTEAFKLTEAYLEHDMRMRIRDGRHVEFFCRTCTMAREERNAGS